MNEKDNRHDGAETVPLCLKLSEERWSLYRSMANDNGFSDKGLLQGIVEQYLDKHDRDSHEENVAVSDGCGEYSSAPEITIKK